MWFANYEVVKLVISDPAICNLIICGAIVAAILLTCRKRDNSFLDFSQTGQLRGIAILLVLCDHLWVLVASKPEGLVLGGEAVSVFLFLSGFGLALSVATHPQPWAAFALRRLKRIFVPYWLVTLAILLLDWLILSRVYPMSEIMLTAMGINLTTVSTTFDYSRWFVTFILSFYVVFILAQYGLRRWALTAITAFALVAMVMHKMDLFQLGFPYYQFLAFPVGCWLAGQYGRVSAFLRSGSNVYQALVVVVAALFLLSLCMITTTESSPVALRATRSLFSNIHGILVGALAILIVAAVGRAGYVSRFLEICGAVSFELYLVQGPLIVKYNPVLSHCHPSYIAAGFVLLVVILLAMAFGLRALSAMFGAREFEKKTALQQSA